MFESLPLRFRFLIIPLIGLVLALILYVASNAIIQNHSRLFQKLNQSDLPQINDISQATVLLTNNYARLSEILLEAFQHQDEEQVYLQGRTVLNDLHEVEQHLKQMAKQKDGVRSVHRERYKNLWAAFEQYRETSISTIELSTVDTGRANKELQQANRRLLELNRHLLVLYEHQLSIMRQQAAQLQGSLYDDDSLNIIAISLLVLMVLSAVVLSRHFSTSLDQINQALVDLSNGHMELQLPLQKDRYLQQLISAVYKFQLTLQQNKLQQQQLEDNLLALGRSEKKSRELISQISEKENWLAQLLDNLPNGVQESNLDGVITFSNPVLHQILGVAEGELVGRHVWDLYAKEGDRQKIKDYLAHVVEEQPQPEPYQVSTVRADGSEVLLEILWDFVYGPNGEITGFISIISDISERKKAQDQVLVMSQALEQSPVSVVITDTHANIEYVNRAFENVTGYSQPEVLGKNPRLLNSGQNSPQLYKDMWQNITTGKLWQGELKNRKKNGELFWEYVHLAPVVDKQSGEIRHFLAVKEDVTLRKKQEEQIQKQAHFDELTDLPNRFLALDRLSQLISEAARDQHEVAVLFLDLDDFKKVNDTLGHETGDKLLIEAAQRLKSVVRSGDTVGRLGGDEFIVLLGGLEHTTACSHVVENLIDQFRNAFSIDDRELMLTASVGVAIYPKDGETVSELLRNADSAMYHSKDLGRNAYSFFTDEMNRNVSRRLRLEEQLHNALARNEFEVFYQPQIEVKSGRITGAEALLRWSNPELGQVSPVEFIPICEQTGLIIPVGQFVLEQALLQAVKFQNRLTDNFTVAVNLSPRQFRDPAFARSVSDALRQARYPGEKLELEITEGVLMSGLKHVDEALETLNDLDVSIAMDDFGTGYSSLSYLRRYPFDVIKIDRSFINDMDEDPADRNLVEAIIQLSHRLNMKVVAEGVETERQYELLKQFKCDYAQGYLFSKPLSTQDFFDLIEQQSAWLLAD